MRYFVANFFYDFNIWKLLGCSQIKKILLYVSHNMLQFCKKNYECLRCILVVMNFLSGLPYFNAILAILSIFLEHWVGDKFQKNYYRLLVLFANFVKIS